MPSSDRTLRRRENTLVFRADGTPSKRFRGATEFGANAMVITNEALEGAYDVEPTHFVETFGDAIYGDSSRFAKSRARDYRLSHHSTISTTKMPNPIT